MVRHAVAERSTSFGLGVKEGQGVGRRNGGGGLTPVAERDAAYPPWGARNAPSPFSMTSSERGQIFHGDGTVGIVGGEHLEEHRHRLKVPADPFVQR